MAALAKIELFGVIDTILKQAGCTHDDYLRYIEKNDVQRLLNETETTKYLKVSKPTLMTFVKSGAIKPVILGKKATRYDKVMLDQFINQLESKTF